MIARGENRLREMGLTSVSYHQGDMRDVRLERQFPLVIAPFNTLMHAYTLSEQDATLQTVRAHMASGGRFAFDLYTPSFGDLNVLRLEPEWQGVAGPESDMFLLQSHDPDTQTLTSHYFLDTTAENGTLTRRRSTLRQRYYHRFELERALRQNGFDQLQFYGDFSRGRATAQAPHIIGVAS